MNKFIAGIGIIALLSGLWWQQYTKADFQTVAGQRISWQSLEGQWVVVNFFAEWCAPCLREIPHLNTFYAQTAGDGVQLFAVSYDQLSHAELVAIKQKYQMQFPVISADPPPTLPVQKPQHLPATYIISPTGQVVKKLLGEQTAESLIAVIEHYQSVQKSPAS